MDLFSHFCNICYKTNKENLKNISEENKENLKDTLITFIGGADIINVNIIYLCRLCSEELIRFKKFKEMCVRNLIQMRQTYFHMKSKLELQGDTSAATNMLIEFLHTELVRYNSPEKDNSADSGPRKMQEIANESVYLNKNDPTCHIQRKNIHSEKRELQFGGNCSDISDINNSENEFIKENIKLEVDESEFGNDIYVDMSVINNTNASSTSQIQLPKELHTKTEIENSTSQDFQLKHSKSESEDYDFDVTVINNCNRSNTAQQFTKEEFHSEIDIENNTTVDFEFKNIKSEPVEDYSFDVSEVNTSDGSGASQIKFGEEEFHIREKHSTANMETCEERDIGSKENLQAEMTLRTGGCNSELRTGPVNTQQLSPYVVQHCNSNDPTKVQTATREHPHSSAELHTYDVCNGSFTNSSALAVLERLHTGARSYKCTICNKAFSISSSLIRHERVHSGARPYKCSVCDKAFTDISNLTRHERIHSGTRPYKCNVCDKAFTQSTTLTRHERTHNDTKPYQCSVCSKAFKNIATLIIHERIHSNAIS